MIGTEHEYSINNGRFQPLPASDRIIQSICSRVESEILFGDTKLGKELQKTVLEFVPRAPAEDLPTLTLDQTAVWDHDEGEYYAVYDRLFDIRQHGWLNIQALQINLSYANDRELISMYNQVRSLLPYLIAVTASSPMVEGRRTGSMDNRLLYYRRNQEEIPGLCNRIIPEKIRSVAEYRAFQEELFCELRYRNADILCEEWVNSAGLIIRFSRRCLEIKALDEQESIHSDMAVCAFVRSLLRCRALPAEEDRDGLLDLTERAIRGGTRNLKQELGKLYDEAWKHATPEERGYLPVIRHRIERGSLAELIQDRSERENDITPVLGELAECLKTNRSYLP
ncbi:MAG: hypothetical protein METHP_00030 [Methanoregula sp. SKADARSKE-2]|nr:MAG: hypothetical protein METHP_00030 [Methanoregula sp. SKADARSKE-2]